ncbi:Cytochrome c biogenesis protein CcsA [Pseudoclavibacter triregionum]|nr:Cytochrome c biogenesis protein CcsA [Pseudoclavibacter triregionum]
MTQLLSDWSNALIYVAMAVYAIAFILFAMDLANRSAGRDALAGAARGTSALGATKRERAGAGVASRRRGLRARRDGAAREAAAGAGADALSPASAGTLTLERGGAAGDAVARVETEASAPGVAMSESRAGDADDWVDRRASRSLRIAMLVTGLGFAIHLASTLLRGLASGRVPWSNMYEYTMTATLLVVLVFLLAQLWNDLRFLGTFITGFVTLCLGISAVGFYVEVAPLQPALQSAWLVIHVFVASLATGCLALGFGLSILQLMQRSRTKALLEGRRSRMGFLGALPGEARLEDLAYRIIVVGFILWTFTLIAGAIWAERAWGRYWGWDTKEVWTFIIWTVYAGYIHARATKGWRGTPSAWLAIVGFGTVLFNFGVVNVFFKGLHTYSGL